MNKTLSKIAITALPLALAAAIVLPVFAETRHNATGTQTQAPTNQVNVACVQAAIEKRDTAIIAAVDAYATAVKSALSTRKDAEKAAWNLTDRNARRTALKAAQTTYRNSVRVARKAFRDARNSAWKQFRTDRKACGGSTGSEEIGSQGLDESL